MTAAHADISRDVESRVDPDELAAWTAANERARAAYYKQPNACTWAIYGRDR